MSLAMVMFYVVTFLYMLDQAMQYSCEGILGVEDISKQLCCSFPVITSL